MALETLASPAEESLKNAQTVGDYAEALEKIHEREQESAGETITTIRNDERGKIDAQLKPDVAKLKQAIAGNENLRIDHSLRGSGEQGNAGVGAGEGTININPDAVDRVLEGKNGDKRFRNLAAHEKAHATLQKPMGDIELAEGTMTGWELHEDHSETKGAEEEGKDARSFNREGQPDDYAAAQEKGTRLRKLGITDAEFDQYIGEGGEAGTRKLQERVIEQEMKKGVTTPQEVAENIRSKRGTYAAAASDVLVSMAA